MKDLIPIAYLSLALTGGASAQLSLTDPLAGIERFKGFEAMRASSSDTNWMNGNADSRPLHPHSSLTLAQLQGPGVITHIWCTLLHGSPYYSREVTLRIYWDGEEHPSVEAPLGDFFGMGHGVDKAFVSVPIRVSSDGKARNCYWPMPFRKSARIVVENESDSGCLAFYYQVDWQKHKKLPADTAYFHAMYRQEFPCRMGGNYLIADLAGRGHYVGTVQSVYIASDGWYGEGDDFFFIDGEKAPRLRGTGTEDYFCDAWGLRQQDGPLYGTPLWEGGGAGTRGSSYRFHLPDPIPFKKSLRVEIEHKGTQVFPDKTFSSFVERDDLMSSVAYWYQAEPHKPWPALPPGSERLPFKEKRLLVGASAIAKSAHSAHPIEEQGIFWATGGKSLLLKAAGTNGWLETPFSMDAEMTGELFARMTLGPEHGKYRVMLDGEPLAEANLYSRAVEQDFFKLGRRKLTAGQHKLRFECAGKAADAGGYFLGLDKVVLRIPVYSRPLNSDLRRLPISEYCYGEPNGEPLMLDVYRPSGTNAAKAKRPGVVLVHGGAWCGGGRVDVAGDARALAAKGYVCFAVDYRLFNGPSRLKDPALPIRNRYPAALDDCQRAVRWIRSRAEEFQVDPDRLAAIGWSAGGHLVGLLGTMDTRDNTDPALARYSSRVNAVVDAFGPADFTQPLPEVNLIGRAVDEKSELWILSKTARWLQDDFLGSADVRVRREASPVHHVDGRTVPFLIMHGAEDTLVPPQQSRTLLARLKAAGKDASLIEFPGEGHGFGRQETRKRSAEEVQLFLDRVLKAKEPSPR